MTESIDEKIARLMTQARECAMPLANNANWLGLEATIRTELAQPVPPATSAKPVPVIVAPDADPDEMNDLHGERYGMDWKYPAANHTPTKEQSNG